MSDAISPPHIYQRAVSGDSQDSLSIIASLIEPGQTLLDLGMGTGGLGHFLSQRHAIVADGVTWNQAEADIAAAWYRHVAVADLDQADLCAIFAGQQYDCIVCADVLEHLKAPEQVLAQCEALLKPGGRLITSVPNAGYCGLIAELIQGEFRYRPEGLLDNTHLRFFTRTSLQRFFIEHGWMAVCTQTTVRQLLESEFGVEFDNLPPAVARYLLAMPDALTYQFVTVLRPSACANAVEQASTLTESVAPGAQSPAVALFSAQVYLAANGIYNERSKLVAVGQIGAAHQVLGFEIPPSTKQYTAIRLDPADRPGYFKLYHLQLRSPDGRIIWQWVAGQSSPALLEQMPHQQMLIQQPVELTDAALLYLYGDDPWLVLPLPAEVLDKLSDNGARLEVSAGWPMSADYLQASAATRQLQTTYEQETANLEAARQCAVLDLKEWAAEHEAERERAAHALKQIDGITAKLNLVEVSLQEVKEDKFRLNGELNASRLETQRWQNQYDQLLVHLQTIEKSTLFRVTRPVAGLKMKLDNLLGKVKSNSPHIMVSQALLPPPLPLPVLPVDIIVPVYRGLEDTQCCVESVLNANCNTAWRLIIINDCSPEPAVTKWLRSVALTDSRIVLLENTENLGFVGTVNRGMAFSADHDVLLLNSDAEVANNWLDRLQQAAYSDLRVASVTPFSNNATICSYPRFCQPNELPPGIDTVQLDQLFAQYLAGQTLPIPTGIGFCMYIRRQCLQEIGTFDEANFGKGYGEENDFCVRAQQAGWVNLHALDTFVRHAGGVSFGDSKNEREQQAMVTLNRLHPKYEADVHDFVKADPASTARMLIDMARITSMGKPVVLNVTHNREGGTLRHIQELAQLLAKKATFLRLSPVPKGAVLNLEGPCEAFELQFELPQKFDQLVQTLRMLQVGHIHYHHLLGHVPGIENLPAQLGVSHDFTVHDFYSYCPQISLTNHTDRYCGEEGLEQCRQCLQRHPAPGGLSIEGWRSQHASLLSDARYLITPSHDAARRMLHYVPTASVRVVPHKKLLPLAPQHPLPKPRQLSDGQPLKIAVLGALSKIKGADVLEGVATLAAARNAPVEFHLIGYAYRNLRTQPKAKLTVHGAYDDQDLPKILQWLQPDVVWFPAVWPETYSYTLSACLESGLPVVAPNIGAFAERLQGRPWSWVADWQQDATTWLAFFEAIREMNFCAATSPAIVETGFAKTKNIKDSVDYYGNYLATLPVPTALTLDQLRCLQEAIDLSEPKRVQPSMQLKSSALRAIMRLRAHALMSPMAKWVPMHLQRRVKSWLGT
jgi:GT2 family glycosyltransferase/2-polyprenyl-3-methyl-5-hydroxy-6-metoxy-1,4-benzoquinol methylase/glycosyltransferase involved in cell wall biosynthesis